MQTVKDALLRRLYNSTEDNQSAFPEEQRRLTEVTQKCHRLFKELEGQFPKQVWDKLEDYLEANAEEGCREIDLAYLQGLVDGAALQRLLWRKPKADI